MQLTFHPGAGLWVLILHNFPEPPDQCQVFCRFVFVFFTLDRVKCYVQDLYWGVLLFSMVLFKETNFLHTHTHPLTTIPFSGPFCHGSSAMLRHLFIQCVSGSSCIVFIPKSIIIYVSIPLLSSSILHAEGGYWGSDW